MFPQKSQLSAATESKTYPLGEQSEQGQRVSMAFVALSHSPVEQQLYAAMLAGIESGNSPATFSARRLMTLTNIRSLSTIRRGLEGLMLKLSIEREKRNNGNGGRDLGAAYRVYAPDEVIERRKERGFSFADGLESRRMNRSFERAISRVVENRNLSRREAQVALCCVEGLTNAQIGSRLQVTEQTVKFHLRHIFIKFAVKRRAELISRLLM
jgi:DNA-binding CsgD family transcriptional regulator